MPDRLQHASAVLPHRVRYSCSGHNPVFRAVHHGPAPLRPVRSGTVQQTLLYRWFVRPVSYQPHHSPSLPGLPLCMPDRLQHASAVLPHRVRYSCSGHNPVFRAVHHGPAPLRPVRSGTVQQTLLYRWFVRPVSYQPHHSPSLPEPPLCMPDQPQRASAALPHQVHYF